MVVFYLASDNMKNKNEILDYNLVIVLLFKQLVEIFGVDVAILYIYKLNSLKGVKI